MVAVRQAAFYCYNAKLDAPSRYGLLFPTEFADSYPLQGVLFNTLSFLLGPCNCVNILYQSTTPVSTK